MSACTINKESVEAVKFFEAKLAFETDPIGFDRAIQSGEPLQIMI